MSDIEFAPESEDEGELHGTYQTVSIVDEMSSAYLDYAMSVIISRALPDLRDGLKPVHRRILYAMHDSGNVHNKPYRKSARPVGDVMGKYHPHGDGAIYGALVRLAQDFVMSLPLLDGQGNFGSMDGDNPAAMRYTEVRLSSAAIPMLQDIEHDTVDFQDNYDGKDSEPVVLPARFPNILVNGGSGIAVGMASSIPPYNLGEVIDATIALIEDPDISSEKLMKVMPGPDFPTGGIIRGLIGSKQTFLHGRGRIVIRAKTHFESDSKNRTSIVIDEIPYLENKSRLVQRIAEVAQDKKVAGISSVQDESDRTGVRVVIELKRGTTPEIVLNQLWRRTPMQSSFSGNLVVLHGGRPRQMNIVEILSAFVEFREEIVTRRTADFLRRARGRSHLLCGLAVAVSNLDEVVGIIRGAAQPKEARERLLERAWPAEEIAEYIRLIDDPAHEINADNTYNLSDAQARAILELRLQRLTAMGIRENTDELKELAERIKDYLAILRSGERIRDIVKSELLEVREKFSIPRRTKIDPYAIDIGDEDLIEPEEMVIIVTQGGYIKRTPLAEYRKQKRGGKGLAGIQTKEEDFVTHLYVTNSRDELLCFATNGRVYKVKTWELPVAGRTTRGRPIVNIFNIPGGFTVAAITPVAIEQYRDVKNSIVFCTSDGKVRRSSLSDYESIWSIGKIAIGVSDDVKLVAAHVCTINHDVLIATERGMVTRFSCKKLRIIKSRYSSGVRGINVPQGDRVIGMETVSSFASDTQKQQTYLRMRRRFMEFDSSLEAAQDHRASASELILDPTGEVSSDEFFEMLGAESLILVIGKDGSGKITSSHEFGAKVNRGGKGVITYRHAGVIAFLKVNKEDQIVLMTNTGRIIRCSVAGISYRSRGSGGVRIMRTDEGEEIVSVAKIDSTKLPTEEVDDPETLGPLSPQADRD